MKVQPKKRQISEESVEAKPRIAEPTSVNEELKSLLKDSADSAWKDMLKGSGETLSKQIFGFGDLSEGQEVSLKKQQKIQQEQKTNEEKPQITSEFTEYSRTVTHAERNGEAQVEMQVSQAVDEIRAEIKKLTQTSKLVERTVKDATADKAPVKPGKYHLNFFDFVLNVLKDATRKLEDSVSYGAVFTSKKQQSHYWKQTNVKKGGTSFMLSGERTSATQTG